MAALNPPAYIFVIDTCAPEDELAACKTAVQQALSMIPEYALVGAGGGCWALGWEGTRAYCWWGAVPSSL